MKFDVVIGSPGPRNFDSVSHLNGDSCIRGTPSDSEVTEGNENISVIYQDDKQVVPYPSIEVGKVLYPVRVGDYITARSKMDGTLYSMIYKVMSITENEVICGPVN